MALGISIALTAYAFYTKTDFTMMGGALWIFCMILFMWGMFSIFYWDSTLYIIYSALGCILYGFYLIYDTQLIAGGKRYSLSFDDYVLGALALFADIIMIFLKILTILLNAKKWKFE